MIKIRHFDYILWDCFGQFVYCIKDDDDQKFFLNFTNMTNWLTCNEIDFRYMLEMIHSIGDIYKNLNLTFYCRFAISKIFDVSRLMGSCIPFDGNN